MILYGQFIEVKDIVAIMPSGNMNGCVVTFKSGAAENVKGYSELMVEMENIRIRQEKYSGR